MRRQNKLYRALILAALCVVGSTAFGQDIPLYSQKLTNSFIYNPAVAGHTFGSVTYSFNKVYSPVNGSPTTSLISAHTPFGGHKYGAGFNFYSETVNFIKNTYFSGAFAYHISFSKYNILSMGVSGEYNSVGIDMGKIVGNTDDPLLADRVNRADFSFGLNFQTQYFKVGAAVNRLATNLELTKNSTDILSEYYSAYVAGIIPIRGVDVLEPTLNIRKLSPLEGNLIYDLGLYYTYDNLVIGGLAYRRGNVLNAVAGLRIAEKLTFGYSYNLVATDYRKALGASHEVSFRYDFNERVYADRYSSAYKNSMAFRRKTMTNSARSKPSAKRSPSAIKRKQNKIRRASPSRRYQNNKKLPKVKKKKFNTKKRRKQNFKRNQRRYNQRGFKLFRR